MYKPDIPYNDLPILPPGNDVETKKILKAAIDAAKTIAELNRIAKTIPNQAILISTLHLQEARSSSEIENIVTTNDKLYEAVISKTNNYDPQTKEVLKYREALWHGFNKIKETGLLTTNLFVEIYRIIKETDAGIRNTPGTRIQNSKGEVLYTPRKANKSSGIN
jgi:Fic family protein